MARPRRCGDETEDAEGCRDTIDPEGRIRDDRLETALGEGACRDSIVNGFCAQLSSKGVETDGVVVESY